MRKKILISTNDDVLFFLLKTFIESLSYFVVCENITDLDSFVKQSKDDVELIIIDAKMSEISAIELSYRIRYEYNIFCNVWLITEISSENYLQKALDVGVNRIVHKPIDPRDLAHEVITHVL